MTYCQWNQNLGYMQGMNDIAAVFLETMENENDTFWCFKGWMESLVLFFIIFLARKFYKRSEINECTT